VIQLVTEVKTVLHDYYELLIFCLL
jgi:hypothetical protein